MANESKSTYSYTREETHQPPAVFDRGQFDKSQFDETTADEIRGTPNNQSKNTYSYTNETKH